MKVERKEAKFEPITLTIESQVELDVISELVALADFVRGTPAEVECIVSKLSEDLLNVGASNEYKYFCDFESRLVAK